MPGQPHPGLPPGTTPGLWRGGGCSARPIPTPPWGGRPSTPSYVQTQTLARIPAPPPRRPCALFLGIFESDDISAIASEMEKALNYSEKVRHAFRGAGRAAPCGSWGCRPVPSSEGPGRNPFPASSGGRVKETRIAPDACEKRGARLYARLLQREGGGGLNRNSRDVGVQSRCAEWRGRGWDTAERDLVRFRGQGSPCHVDLTGIVLKAGRGLRRPLTPKASDEAWGVLQGAGLRPVCCPFWPPLRSLNARSCRNSAPCQSPATSPVEGSALCQTHQDVTSPEKGAEQSGGGPGEVEAAGACQEQRERK